MTMADLTEYQYEELRTYEHGLPSWHPHRPNSNLIRRNLLALAPSCGQGFYRITEYGQALLVAFREKHGIREDQPKEVDDGLADSPSPLTL
jgi:hypothetical protein